MKTAAVIGAGISGLVSARALLEKGYQVKVFDPAIVGGVVQTSTIDGFTVECGPNVLIEKPELRSLIDQLGLADQIVYPAVPAYRQEIWYKGKARTVPKGPLALLRTPLIPFSEKIGLIRAIFSSHPEFVGKEDMSILEAVSLLVGPQTANRVVEPVLRGIYGGKVSELSMRSVFRGVWENLSTEGKIFSKTKKKGPKAAKPQIFTLRNGLSSLISALKQMIESEVEFVAERVVSVQKVDSGFRVTTESKKEFVVEHLSCATSGSSTSSWLGSVVPDISELAERVSFAPIVVVHLAVTDTTNVPPDSFGVLFPAEKGSALLGVMYNSILFPHVAPEGSQLLTVCLGGVGAEELLELGDQSLINQAIEAVRGKLKIKPERALNVTRWRSAIPQYTVGHWKLEQAISKAEQELDELQFVGVDIGGVGVPDRVRVASRC